MDFRKLRNFVVLAEELSFARAAEKVHLTQPAFSRSISTLENELGARLFDRDNNVLLTPVGKMLLSRAQSLLLDLGSLKQEVCLMAAGETGQISMGVGPFPGAVLMPPVLAELVREKPLVSIDIEINSPRHLLEHLLNEEIEFFVADLLSVPQNSHISVLPLERLYLSCVVRAGHPLTLKKDLMPLDILDYPLVSARLLDPRKKVLENYLEVTAGRTLRLSVVCDNPVVLKYVTLNSDAIAITSFVSGHDETTKGNLVALPVPRSIDLSSELVVVSLKGRTFSPIAQSLIERMRQLAIELAKS
jgi:DNA-binding transcriptional LysR family regulator